MTPPSQQRTLLLLGMIGFLGLGGLSQLWLAPAATPLHAAPAAEELIFLPQVACQGCGTPTRAATPVTPASTPTPTQEREWDPRLDQRGAKLITAQPTPGQGYWRLIRAVWFDEQEAQGTHHIFVDLLDEAGQRQVDKPVLVTWADGQETIKTQAKPGEPYAADFGMFSIAPSYRAQPSAGGPADSVDGLGMGSIEQPKKGIHTSYGLTWQWTIEPTATLTPTAALTPTLTSTPTAPITNTLTPTPTGSVTGTTTPTPTGTPSPTSTATPTVSSTPTASPTATPTATATAEQQTYLFPEAKVVSCVPNNQQSAFAGTVTLAGQPVNGQRVVFSYEADGPHVTQPASTGPNPPGFYTHIISVGGARQGTWFVWLVDPANQRISALASFTTDGNGGACNVATVNFAG